MKEISVKKLKELQDGNEDSQLIDVREPHEYEICNINGELIPVGDVVQKADQVSRDKMVVVHCRSGARSANVIRILEMRYNLDNLYNLKGGILKYADEIDPSLEKY